VYKTNVPANYIDVVDYNDTCGTIHDIDVYYDNKDQQTYGLVQFKKDTKLVRVQAEALFQSKFYRSDNMRQLLRYLKSQANNQKRFVSNPYTKPLRTSTNKKTIRVSITKGSFCQVTETTIELGV
jgi:hypothetical protein